MPRFAAQRRSATVAPQSALPYGYAQTNWRNGFPSRFARTLGLLPEELVFFERQLNVSVFGMAHSQIKRAYYVFCQRYHPDKTGGIPIREQQQRTELFKRVTAVYERLDVHSREQQRSDMHRSSRMASVATPRTSATVNRPPFR